MSSVGREKEKEKENDPLLKDLSEKKERFRRSVVSLAAELNDLRHRLSAKEHSLALQTLSTQKSLPNMKSPPPDGNDGDDSNKHMKQRQRQRTWKKRCINCRTAWRERERVLQTSACTADKHLKELDDLRSQLSIAQATADASATSAQIAQIQSLELAKELDTKNISLKEHEIRVNKLGEQLDLLQKDLQARELSQKQLKDEVSRVEHDIMLALSKSTVNKECELMKMLDKVSPRNFEKINKLLTLKDEEISKLRDEIRIMSAHWNIKTKELESQLEKHKRSDQELKKRVLKLEFCLQEARAQTRKLQRMGERRDKAIKELHDQLATKRPSENSNSETQFWESSGFKIMASMSMLILVLFSKR